MKIGPIQFAKESANAYLAFGSTGLDVVFEPTDADGLASLRRRNPGEVLVCEPALKAAGAKLGLATAKVPEHALAVKAELAVRLSHGTMMSNRVPPELMLEFTLAAVAFWEAAPWRVFEADEAIAVQLDKPRHTYEACVMGQGAEEFGLALYALPGSLAQIQKHFELGHPEDSAALEATSVLLETEPCAAVDAVKELTGVPVSPLLMRVKHGEPAQVGAADLAIATAALRAVTALAAGGVEATGRAHEASPRVQARATRGAAPRTEVETADASGFGGVGRNEPCPCGSGKKFKKCHLETGGAPAAAQRETAPGEPLHDRSRRLVDDLGAWAVERFGQDFIERAGEALWGKRRRSQPLLPPVALFEWPVEGRPLVAHFLAGPGARFDSADRGWLEAQQRARVAIYEVLAVEKNLGLRLLDLLSGAQCFVHERRATESLCVRDAVLARVVDFEDLKVLAGNHEAPLGPDEADALLQKVRAEALKPGPWATTVRLIELWDEAVGLRAIKAASPSTVRNTDGHQVVLVEDAWTVAAGGFASAFARLAALEGVVVDDQSKRGATLSFTRPGNAVHPSWSNTCIGSAKLTGTRLVVSANSLERADALKARLTRALGDAATWKKRTQTRPESGSGGHDLVVDAQAVSGPSAMGEFMRSWLDAPSPALDGKTPREAVEDPAGRAKVHLLLKSLENSGARAQPPGGLDPTHFRRELGLTELGEFIPHRALVRALGSSRKISETLLEFAQPLFEVAGPGLNEQGMKQGLRFATEVWNIEALREQGASRAELAKARRAIKPGVFPQSLLALYDRLVERKRTRYPGDLRTVGKWSVTESKGRVGVMMEARLPPEVIERARAAGLKPGD